VGAIEPEKEEREEQRPSQADRSAEGRSSRPRSEGRAQVSQSRRQHGGGAQEVGEEEVVQEGDRQEARDETHHHYTKHEDSSRGTEAAVSCTRETCRLRRFHDDTTATINKDPTDVASPCRPVVVQAAGQP
jgi:hypothetical protein